MCVVVFGALTMSFSAFAPAVQDHVSGQVLDQSTNSPLSDIYVQEIVNGQVISTVKTDGSGLFSIPASVSPVSLRFSDQDYQEYRMKVVSFDLREDCSNVRVYMDRVE